MFIFQPIPLIQVAPLFGLPEAALARAGAVRLSASEGAPCRLSLADAEPGQSLLLLHYEHQPAGPYKASGPIFVSEGAVGAPPLTDVPPSFRKRLYSARAYGSDDLMLDAEVIEGQRLEDGLAKLFEEEAVAYVHLHHARRGCFACRVDRT